MLIEHFSSNLLVNYPTILFFMDNTSIKNRRDCENPKVLTPKAIMEWIKKRSVRCTHHHWKQSYCVMDGYIPILLVYRIYLLLKKFLMQFWDQVNQIKTIKGLKRSPIMIFMHK